MDRLGPLAIAAAVGALAGALIGAYLARGDPRVLGAALVGLGVAVVAPLALWRQESRQERRRDLEATIRERQSRYHAHTEQLNEQAVRPLRTLHLQGPSGAGPLPPHARLGLSVDEGETTRPVEQLPNWSYAVEHLQGDPVVGPSWSATEVAVRRYRALREGTEESLSGRYTHLLLSRYGFETPLEGGRFDPPPWFDARAFVGVALSVRGPLDRSTITVVPAMVDDAADDDPSAPHLVLVGETPVACAASRDAANPGEIADLVELGRSGAATGAALRALSRAEHEARAAVRRMAEESRRYSDRMLIEPTGSGACEVCRPWLDELRARTAEYRVW